VPMKKLPPALDAPRATASRSVMVTLPAPPVLAVRVDVPALVPTLMLPVVDARFTAGDTIAGKRITDTLSDPKLETKAVTFSPTKFTNCPNVSGSTPTPTVATTVLVPVPITETFLL